MTLTEALVKAPAIGATAPDPRVSARYAFVPTLPIVEAMLERGWTIADARQNHNTDPFAMHRVTFGLPLDDACAQRLVDECWPTAHLFNSHNRTRQITWCVGLHVCICANQAHCPIDGLGTELTRFHLQGHTGAFTPAALFDSAAESHAGLAARVNDMRQLTLTDSQRLDLAQDALALLRNAASRNFVPRADAEPLLYAQREAQRPLRDLWTTFNIVQENAIERGRRGRGVHEILRNNKLNSTLWQNALSLLN